jgi:hypothetical protein
MQKPLKKLYFYIKEARLFLLSFSRRREFSPLSFPANPPAGGEGRESRKNIIKSLVSCLFKKISSLLSLRAPAWQSLSTNQLGFTKLKPFLGIFFIISILSISVFFAFSDDGNKTFKEGKQYTVVSGREMS